MGEGDRSCSLMVTQIKQSAYCACRSQMVPPGYRQNCEEEATPWWRLRGGRGTEERDDNEDSSSAATGGRKSGDNGEGAVLWAAQSASGRRGMPRPLPLLLQQSLSSKATQAQELAALRELQEQQPQSRFNGMRSPSRINYSEPGSREADSPSWSGAATAAAASPSLSRPPSDPRSAAAGGLSSPLPQRRLTLPPSQEDYPSHPSSGLAAQYRLSNGSGNPAAGNEPSDMVLSLSRRKPSFFARGSRKIVALDRSASIGGGMPTERRSSESTSPPGSTLGGASPSVCRQEKLGDTLHSSMQDHADPEAVRSGIGGPLPYGRAGGMDTGASSTEVWDHPRARTIGGTYDSWRQASSPGVYGDAGAAVDGEVGGPDQGRPSSPHGLEAGDSGVLPALRSSFAAAAISAATAAAAQRGVPGVSPAHGPARPWSPSVGATGAAHSYSGAAPWPAEPKSPFSTGVHGLRAEAAAGAPGSAPASPGGTRPAGSRSAWRRAVEAAALEAGGTGSTVQEVNGVAPGRSSSNGGLVLSRPGSANVRRMPMHPGLLSHAAGSMAQLDSGQMVAPAGVRGSPLSQDVGGSAHSGGGNDSPRAARGLGSWPRVRFGEPEVSSEAEPQLHQPGKAVDAAGDGAQDNWEGQNPLFREDGSRSDGDRSDDGDRGASAGGMDADGREHTGSGSNTLARFRGMREGDREDAGSLYGHDSELVNVRQHSASSSRNASPARSVWRLAGNASPGVEPQTAEVEPGTVMGSAPLRPKSARRPEALRSAVPSSPASGGARGSVWSPRAASSLAEATPMHEEGTGDGMPWPFQNGGQQPAEDYSYPARPVNVGAMGIANQRQFAVGGMRGSEPGTATRRGSGLAALEVGRLATTRGWAEGATSNSPKAVAGASEVSAIITVQPPENLKSRVRGSQERAVFWHGCNARDFAA